MSDTHIFILYREHNDEVLLYRHREINPTRVSPPVVKCIFATGNMLGI
jgi:hypothetical protein